MAIGKISIQEFDRLIQQLSLQYEVIGPTKKDFVISYEPIKSISDLPKGYYAEQSNGSYTLKAKATKRYFGFNLASNSIKNYLFPPKKSLYQINKQGHVFYPTINKTPKYAFLGVRACELHAILIQDRVLMGENGDRQYRERRENCLIVSLNCATTAKTCFCVSMNTGPNVTMGFDLNLTEIIDNKAHFFIIESGTDKGHEFFAQLNTAALSERDKQKKQSLVQRTTKKISKQLDTQNIKERLYSAQENPVWDNVANKCINCGNCTSVCPTCFCSKTTHETDLQQNHATVNQTWDTCFSLEFTHIHHQATRQSAKARYRHWLTHKLASWFDQFGTSGCVGCGKCIAWCPVGIDITEETTKLINYSEESNENN